MSNFCYPTGPVVTLFMPALRKQFPFLYRDRLPGRCVLHASGPEDS